MQTVVGQLVSSEQMADILATSTETKSVSAGELKARWLDTGLETIILIEGLNGEGLRFSSPLH